MNKDIRLERLLSNSDNKRISVHDYAVALKLSGFTMDEAIDKVERMAIRDKVEKIYVQTEIVLKVYLDDNIKIDKRRIFTKIHTEEEWDVKKNQYDNSCFYCGKKNIKLTKDHVIPIVLGGTDDIDNIVPACQSCNSKKQARRLEYVKQGTLKIK